MLAQSLWRAHQPAPFSNQPLPNEVDVVVVGGGIAGLTAAYLFKQGGKRVAVFEKDRIGSGETGNTTAHLTCVNDARISKVARQFGENTAQLVWRAGATAIDVIESNATERGIDCAFRRVPGFLCSAFFDEDSGDGPSALREDAELARRLGFATSFIEAGPITGRPAMRVADQALFNPMDYIAGLASVINGDGSFVFEDCEVGDVIDDPLAVIVNGENIVCRDLMIATHVPIVGKRNLLGATLFQTKLYPYSSYVLGARLSDDRVAPGLYWDTTDSYYYLRVHEDADGFYAIFGGEDHKTGQESDTESRFTHLTEAFQRLVPSAAIERRWSGQ
ncbi:MAG TPA: FAD-binding oxidoreductase, partial [Gemmatimonadaceae bacterium]|nr:FAD-binding oxidoreductase [Gemmatimonadaceae bacterium]